MSSDSRLQRWFYRRHLRLSQISRSFRHRFTGQGQVWLVLFAMSFLPSLDASKTLAYQLVSLLAAMFLVAAIGSRLTRCPALELERQLPDLATAGQTTITTLKLRCQRDLQLELNDAPQARWPSYEDWLCHPDPKGIPKFDRWTGYPRFDQLARNLNPKGDASFQAVSLKAGLSSEVKIPFTPPRRGRYRWRRVEHYRREPLGLMRAKGQQSCESQLIALPKPIGAVEALLGLQRGLHRGGYASLLDFGHHEPAGHIRDYQRGDALKRIHWKSSAKSGQLKVLADQDPVLHKTTFVFDRQMAQWHDFEGCLRLLCALIMAKSEPESHRQLFFFEGETLTHDVSHPRPLAALKALATTEGQTEPTLYPLLPSLDRDSSPCLLLTSLWGEQQRGFVNALKKNRRSLQVLLVMEDQAPPDFEGLGRQLRPSQLDPRESEAKG